MSEGAPESLIVPTRIIDVHGKTYAEGDSGVLIPVELLDATGVKPDDFLFQGDDGKQYKSIVAITPPSQRTPLSELLDQGIMNVGAINPEAQQKRTLVRSMIALLGKVDGQPD